MVSPVGAMDELVDDDESGADDPYDHTLRTGTMLWSWEALGRPFGRTFVRPFRRMCVTASSDARRSARSTRRTRPCVRRSTRSRWAHKSCKLELKLHLSDRIDIKIKEMNRAFEIKNALEPELVKEMLDAIRR